MRKQSFLSARQRIGRYDSLVAALLFGLSLAWFLIAVVYPASMRQTHGFAAYYSAARLLAEGGISEQIYDPDYFRPIVEANTGGRASDIYNANPPTTSLILWPLSGLDIDLARTIWNGLSLLLLLAGIALLLRVFAPEAGVPVFLALFSLGLLFRPVIHNVLTGQAYLLVFFLLALALVGFQERRPAAGGLALAIALLLKTTGWPLLLLLAWLRRWRFLAWTLAIAGLVVLTLPLFPLSMWIAYLDLLAEVTNSPLVCVTAYQTTRSFLCHLFDPYTVWTDASVQAVPPAVDNLSTGMAILVFGAILALTRQRPAAAFAGMIAWGILFAPLGEQHHHVVMLIPAIWLLAGWSRGNGGHWLARASLILGVFAYIVPYPIFHPRLQTGWWALLAYPRLYAAWLILFSLLIHQRFAPPPPTPAQPPSTAIHSGAPRGRSRTGR